MVLLRDGKFIRYLGVGLLNTAVGYALFASLYLVGMAPSEAVIAATALGAAFAFFSTGHLVFGGARLRQFIPFIIGYGAILLINIGTLKLLIGVGAGPLLGQLACLPAVVPLSFLMNRYLVFRQRSSSRATLPVGHVETVTDCSRAGRGRSRPRS